MISKPFDPETWSAHTPEVDLNDNSVHLLRIELDRPFLASLRETLSVTEALHAGRITSDLDRRRFISGCGQLRVILSQYLGIAPAKVPLGYGLSGEPLTIRSPENLFFDWARAEGIGLIAVSRLNNVAVELEAVCTGLPFEMLANHFFEPRENWDVRTAPKPEQTQRFFQTWTGREALRRAGETFSTVRELTPAPGFAAAVAAEGESWSLHYREG